VTISSVEAGLSGRHIGRAPAEPANAIRLQSFADAKSALPAVQAWSDQRPRSPCPFLVDSVCSIYEVRPLAGRLLLNLDDDDLLCKLVPGPDIPVPYADSGQIKTLYLMAKAAAPLADIRNFFPSIGTRFASLAPAYVLRKSLVGGSLKHCVGPHGDLQDKGIGWFDVAAPHLYDETSPLPETSMPAKRHTPETGLQHCD